MSALLWWVLPVLVLLTACRWFAWIWSEFPPQLRRFLVKFLGSIVIAAALGVTAMFVLVHLMGKI
jgi:hypothetical protein